MGQGQDCQVPRFSTILRISSLLPPSCPPHKYHEPGLRLGQEWGAACTFVCVYGYTHGEGVRAPSASLQPLPPLHSEKLR